MRLVNGLEADFLSVDDRGLLYGDGVFRTLKRAAGVNLCWRRHYRKLAADCSALGLSCPDAMPLEAELERLPADCVAKIVVTRGIAKRGYAVDCDAPATRIVAASPMPVYPEEFGAMGVRVHLCSLRLAHQPRLAGVKHLNRLENVLARMEWNDPGVAEGLLLDQGEAVVEGTMSNLLVYHGATLYTPDLSQCGVAGVQRERVMELAAELGIAARVADLPLEWLMDADELMLCNSVFGVWKVREFNRRRWIGTGLTEQLREMLEGRDD